jgi:Tfp pilus assembly protein PilV
MTHRTAFVTRLRGQHGVSLIETAIACAMMVTVLAGLASIAAVATMHTENEGHLSARTAEYAQDKLEQLLVLAYTDTLSNTVQFPAAATGGTGLSVGGSITSPVNGYVDWLGNDGSLLGGGTTAPSAWFYKRMWQITMPTTGVKQLTVVVSVRSSVGGTMLPKSTVVAVKAYQF